MGESEDENDASTVVSSEGSSQDDAPMAQMGSTGRRRSMAEIQTARDGALGLAEVIELQDRSKELEKQLRKWQRERLELEGKCEAIENGEELAETLTARRNLQTALSVIVQIIGKEDMEQLMTTKDDAKLLKRLKSLGQGNQNSAGNSRQRS